MDDEPFCHHHDDTEQAQNWIAAVRDAADNDAREYDCAVTCNHCQQPIIRTVARLTEAAFDPKTVVTEDILACSCTSIVDADRHDRDCIPDHWPIDK